MGCGPTGPRACVVVVEQIFLLLVADSSLALPTIPVTTRYASETTATSRAALATIGVAFTTIAAVASTTTVPGRITAAVTARLASATRTNGVVVVNLVVVVSLGGLGRAQSGSKDQADNQSK